MKKFDDFYSVFIQYIKNLKGHPEFNNCIFFFLDTHRNSYKYRPHDFEYKNMEKNEAEIMYNKLLEDGCSWINMIAMIIRKKTLYIRIENSRNFDPFFVGKTDVKYSADLFGNMDCLEFYWNLSIFKRFKYRKRIKKIL